VVGHVYVKSGGAWVEPTNLYVKSGRAWIEPLEGWVKTAGNWEQFYPQVTVALDLDFTVTTTLDPRITFTRARIGTYYDAAGSLSYAANNILLSSQDFTTNWTKLNGATVTGDNITAPDATLTADRLNHVTAGTVEGGQVSQSVGLFPNPMILSVYAKAGTKNFVILGNNGTGDNLYCWFNLATGAVGTRNPAAWTSAGIQNAGGGWYRCWAVAIPAAPTFFLIRVGQSDNNENCTSPGDIYLWGAQLEMVTTATTPATYIPTTAGVVHSARFDYDPITHAARGLLLEESRTNALQRAQEFDNAYWTKTGVTVTPNNTTAPDGMTTADLITTSATTATVERASGVGFGDYVQSVYAKKGTSDWFYLCAKITGTGAQTPSAYFNLSTGTIGTVEALIKSAKIQDVGNGWYRCAIVSASTAGAESFQAGVCDANGSVSVTVGRTIYLWGAQLEEGAFITSYIPTIDGSVTRVSDVALMTGPNFSSWYNESAGTFVAEFDLSAASGIRGILAADDDTASDTIRLYGNGTNPKVTIANNNVTQADIDAGTIAANTLYKLGVSYALNDVAACLNGGTVGADTVATLPTPTQLRIGAESASLGNILSGHLRRVQFWNTAKGDAELQALTT